MWGAGWQVSMAIMAMTKLDVAPACQITTQGEKDARHLYIVLSGQFEVNIQTEKGSQKAPAGYVTTYSVPGKTFPSKGPDAAFLTIRLAGHMVPTFQPEAALAFIARYFRGEEF